MNRDNFFNRMRKKLSFSQIRKDREEKKQKKFRVAWHRAAPLFFKSFKLGKTKSSYKVSSEALAEFIYKDVSLELYALIKKLGLKDDLSKLMELYVALFVKDFNNYKVIDQLFLYVKKNASKIDVKSVEGTTKKFLQDTELEKLYDIKLNKNILEEEKYADIEKLIRLLYKSYYTSVIKYFVLSEILNRQGIKIPALFVTWEGRKVADFTLVRWLLKKNFFCYFIDCVNMRLFFHELKGLFDLWLTRQDFTNDAFFSEPESQRELAPEANVIANSDFTTSEEVIEDYLNEHDRERDKTFDEDWGLEEDGFDFELKNTVGINGYIQEDDSPGREYSEFVHPYIPRKDLESFIPFFEFKATLWLKFVQKLKPFLLILKILGYILSIPVRICVFIQTEILYNFIKFFLRLRKVKFYVLFRFVSRKYSFYKNLIGNLYYIKKFLTWSEKIITAGFDGLFKIINRMIIIFSKFFQKYNISFSIFKWVRVPKGFEKFIGKLKGYFISFTIVVSKKLGRFGVWGIQKVGEAGFIFFKFAYLYVIAFVAFATVPTLYNPEVLGTWLPLYTEKFLILFTVAFLYIFLVVFLRAFAPRSHDMFWDLRYELLILLLFLWYLSGYIPDVVSMGGALMNQTITEQPQIVNMVADVIASQMFENGSLHTEYYNAFKNLHVGAEREMWTGYDDDHEAGFYDYKYIRFNLETPSKLGDAIHYVSEWVDLYKANLQAYSSDTDDSFQYKHVAPEIVLKYLNAINIFNEGAIPIQWDVFFNLARKSLEDPIFGLVSQHGNEYRYIYRWYTGRMNVMRNFNVEKRVTHLTPKGRQSLHVITRYFWQTFYRNIKEPSYSYFFWYPITSSNYPNLDPAVSSGYLYWHRFTSPRPATPFLKEHLHELINYFGHYYEMDRYLLFRHYMPAYFLDRFVPYVYEMNKDSKFKKGFKMSIKNYYKFKFQSKKRPAGKLHFNHKRMLVGLRTMIGGWVSNTDYHSNWSFPFISIRSGKEFMYVKSGTKDKFGNLVHVWLSKGSHKVHPKMTMASILGVLVPFYYWCENYFFSTRMLSLVNYYYYVNYYVRKTTFDSFHLGKAALTTPLKHKILPTGPTKEYLSDITPVGLSSVTPKEDMNAFLSAIDVYRKLMFFVMGITINDDDDHAVFASTMLFPYEPYSDSYTKSVKDQPSYTFVFLDELHKVMDQSRTKQVPIYYVKRVKAAPRFIHGKLKHALLSQQHHHFVNSAQARAVTKDIISLGKSKRVFLSYLGNIFFLELPEEGRPGFAFPMYESGVLNNKWAEIPAQRTVFFNDIDIRNFIDKVLDFNFELDDDYARNVNLADGFTVEDLNFGINSSKQIDMAVVLQESAQSSAFLIDEPKRIIRGNKHMAKIYFPKRKGPQVRDRDFIYGRQRRGRRRHYIEAGPFESNHRTVSTYWKFRYAFDYNLLIDYIHVKYFYNINTSISLGRGLKFEFFDKLYFTRPRKISDDLMEDINFEMYFGKKYSRHGLKYFISETDSWDIIFAQLLPEKSPVSQIVDVAYLDRVKDTSDLYTLKDLYFRAPTDFYLERKAMMGTTGDHDVMSVVSNIVANHVIESQNSDLREQDVMSLWSLVSTPELGVKRVFGGMSFDWVDNSPAFYIRDALKRYGNIFPYDLSKKDMFHQISYVLGTDQTLTRSEQDLIKTYFITEDPISNRVLTNFERLNWYSFYDLFLLTERLHSNYEVVEVGFEAYNLSRKIQNIDVSTLHQPMKPYALTKELYAFSKVRPGVRDYEATQILLKLWVAEIGQKMMSNIFSMKFWYDNSFYVVKAHRDVIFGTGTWFYYFITNFWSGFKYSIMNYDPTHFTNSAVDFTYIFFEVDRCIFEPTKQGTQSLDVNYGWCYSPVEGFELFSVVDWVFILFGKMVLFYMGILNYNYYAFDFLIDTMFSVFSSENVDVNDKNFEKKMDFLSVYEQSKYDLFKYTMFTDKSLNMLSKVNVLFDDYDYNNLSDYNLLFYSGNFTEFNLWSRYFNTMRKRDIIIDFFYHYRTDLYPGYINWWLGTFFEDLSYYDVSNFYKYPEIWSEDDDSEAYAVTHLGYNMNRSVVSPVLAQPMHDVSLQSEIIYLAYTTFLKNKYVMLGQDQKIRKELSGFNKSYELDKTRWAGQGAEGWDPYTVLERGYEYLDLDQERWTNTILYLFPNQKDIWYKLLDEAYIFLPTKKYEKFYQTFYSKIGLDQLVSGEIRPYDKKLFTEHSKRYNEQRTFQDRSVQDVFQMYKPYKMYYEGKDYFMRDFIRVDPRRRESIYYKKGLRLYTRAHAGLIGTRKAMYKKEKMWVKRRLTNGIFFPYFMNTDKREHRYLKLRSLFSAYSYDDFFNVPARKRSLKKVTMKNRWYAKDWGIKDPNASVFSDTLGILTPSASIEGVMRSVENQNFGSAIEITNDKKQKLSNYLRVNTSDVVWAYLDVYNTKSIEELYSSSYYQDLKEKWDFGSDQLDVIEYSDFFKMLYHMTYHDDSAIPTEWYYYKHIGAQLNKLYPYSRLGFLPTQAVDYNYLDMRINYKRSKRGYLHYNRWRKRPDLKAETFLRREWFLLATNTLVRNEIRGFLYPMDATNNKILVTSEFTDIGDSYWGSEEGIDELGIDVMEFGMGNNKNLNPNVNTDFEDDDDFVYGSGTGMGGF